jgi:hypothetical protein
VDKIESLNSARKEKLMTTRSNWSENFQQALSAYSGFKNIESGVVQVRFYFGIDSKSSFLQKLNNST